MPDVRADAVDAFAEVEAVEPGCEWTLVVVEADERQRADVDALSCVPSGCCTARSSLMALVGVASKRKP